MRRLAAALFLLAISCGLANATIRCLTREMDSYRDQIRSLPASEMLRTHAPADPMAPPPDPNVGDSWLWYTWRLAGPPVAVQKLCTVRGEGTHVYVVVEDSQWLSRVFQDDVDAIVNAWDNASIGPYPAQGIYEIDTTHFGTAPDQLDNDPKIYVLLYDFDISADGFFWVFDQYPDGTQPYASNECEVLYINSSDNDPGGSYLISVMAHEFEHMIHWLADADEDAWVDEGMAELGMWLYGDPDPVIQFPTAPDNDLTSWTGAFADYVKTYLWSLYFYEQFGGQPAVWDLLHEPANGVQGYENVLDGIGSPLNFIDVFANWTCANYLDNPVLDEGQYGYVGETLPVFTAALKSAYPVPITSAGVQRYAADYVKFISGSPMRLRFDGADAGTWKPRILFLNAGAAQRVANVPLDAADAGYFDLVDFGETHDTTVLVIAKTAPIGATTYQYWTESVPAAAGDFSRLALHLGAGSPNPMRGAGTIALELPRAQGIDLSVFDSSGRIVRTLANGLAPAGRRDISWDARDGSGRTVPPGVYFVRLRAEDGAAMTRWVRID